MSDDADHRCEKCGREFDSEKGLHIHQSKVHAREEEHRKVEIPEVGLESSQLRILAPLIGVIFIVVVALLFINYYGTMPEGGKVGKTEEEVGGTEKVESAPSEEDTPSQNAQSKSVKIVVLPENETAEQTAS